MAIETTNSTAEFEAFVLERVKSGRYANAGEAYEAAKGALGREERYVAKLVGLKQAIAEGEAGGMAAGNIFARVRERAGLPPRVNA